MATIGINLTGGGARGSYQAGALKALAEILQKRGLKGDKNPLRVWSGTSAGAINATYCAAYSQDLYAATQNLSELWGQLTPDQIYRTDFASLGANSMKWIRDLSFGSLLKTKRAQWLLNTAPLGELLRKNIPFDQIQKSIDASYIDGISCSAYSFHSSKTVSFLQTKSKVGWDRPRRFSKMTSIQANHVLASCSIPLLFPPTVVDGAFYADGGFRNTTPISPAIHMGSNKILMIGVRYSGKDSQSQDSKKEPGVARIAGSILNALFFDTLDIDLERINHINEIIRSVHRDIKTDRSDYSVVDYKMIRPTEDIAKIAQETSPKAFPRMLQFLIDGLGTKEDTSDLSSYILFDSAFTQVLIDMGYRDLMSRKDEIEEWILSP